MALWLIVAITLGVFLHPVLLANVLTFVLGTIASARGITFSVKRVSLLSLTFTGVCLELKNEKMKTEIGDISLSIQFRKALASWFEERPFKLRVVNIHVDVSQSAVLYCFTC